LAETEANDRAIAGSSLANGITNDDLDGLQPPCAASVKSLSLLPDWANVNKDVAITDFVYFGCSIAE